MRTEPGPWHGSGRAAGGRAGGGRAVGRAAGERRPGGQLKAKFLDEFYTKSINEVLKNTYGRVERNFVKHEKRFGMYRLKCGF